MLAFLFLAGDRLHIVSEILNHHADNKFTKMTKKKMLINFNSLLLNERNKCKYIAVIINRTLIIYNSLFMHDIFYLIAYV